MPAQSADRFAEKRREFRSHMAPAPPIYIAPTTDGGILSVWYRNWHMKYQLRSVRVSLRLDLIDFLQALSQEH